jgi:peptide deformylase
MCATVSGLLEVASLRRYLPGSNIRSLSIKLQEMMQKTENSQIAPKFLRFGDPKLYEVSRPFVLPSEMPLAHQTLQLMKQATESIGNVGLAASQIGILRRIVMFEVPAKHPRYKTDGVTIPMQVLINPSYKPLSDEKNLEREGCLSVPGMLGQVLRYTDVDYQYTDLEGNISVRKALGFHARVVQHELDHLDGFLFPLRIKGKHMRSFGFTEAVIVSSAFLQSRQVS